MGSCYDFETTASHQAAGLSQLVTMDLLFLARKQPVFRQLRLWPGQKALVALEPPGLDFLGKHMPCLSAPANVGSDVSAYSGGHPQPQILADC